MNVLALLEIAGIYYYILCLAVLAGYNSSDIFSTLPGMQISTCINSDLLKAK